MPIYECDGCGACCRTFPIFASEADARREPRIALEGRKLPEALATQEYVYQLYPLPFPEGCSFLDGEDRCTIYDSRPDVCRRLCRRRRAVPGGTAAAEVAGAGAAHGGLTSDRQG
jgi:Fe-S-cluster containining protein